MLKDGLPQGLALASPSQPLFNVHTADLPTTQSIKLICAYDIALATQHKDFGHTKTILVENLSSLNEYFKKCKRNPNPPKTEMACSHLRNMQEKIVLN